MKLFKLEFNAVKYTLGKDGSEVEDDS